MKHKPGETFPDGTNPAALRKKWEPFIQDCLLLLDGKGTFRHWKYIGALADQPWLDIYVYRVIRGRWVELMNKQARAGFDRIKPGGMKKPRRPSLHGRRRR